MEYHRIDALGSDDVEHIGSRVVAGRRIRISGVAIHAPGQRNHAPGEHRHEDEEVLVIVAGKGVLHTADGPHPIRAGDVIAVGPWEEHDIEASVEAPTISFWFHVDDVGNSTQYGGDAAH